MQNKSEQNNPDIARQKIPEHHISEKKRWKGWFPKKKLTFPPFFIQAPKKICCVLIRLFCFVLF